MKANSRKVVASMDTFKLRIVSIPGFIFQKLSNTDKSSIPFSFNEFWNSWKLISLWQCLVRLYFTTKWESFTISKLNLKQDLLNFSCHFCIMLWTGKNCSQFVWENRSQNKIKRNMDNDNSWIHNLYWYHYSLDSWKSVPRRFSDSSETIKKY